MRSRRWKHVRAQELVIDLERFTCGQSMLEGIIASTEYFAKDVLRREVFVDTRNGIEVGGEQGRLDYVFVTINRFSGRFLKAGLPIRINAETTEEDIVSLFGPPYWTDRSDGEANLFYEYQEGRVELQFEFWDGKKLSHVTLTRKGVLSTAEDRAAYGVTRSWPPKEIEGRSPPGEIAGSRPRAEIDDQERYCVMPVWLHALLDTVLTFAGLALWWILMAVFWPWQALAGIVPNGNIRGLLTLLTCIAGLGVGLVLSTWFRKVPARCKKCGGKSFAEGNRPVRYLCQNCGFLEITNVRNSWGRA